MPISLIKHFRSCLLDICLIVELKIKSRLSMVENLKGKNLRGRSFKHQDLSNADFSDCNLGGVDFSGANLSGAKFCRAQMGRTHVCEAFFLLWLFAVGVASSFLIALAGDVLVHSIDSRVYFEELLKEINLPIDYNLLVQAGLITLLICTLVSWFIKHSRLVFIVFFIFLVVAVVVVVDAALAVVGGAQFIDIFYSVRGYVGIFGVVVGAGVGVLAIAVSVSKFGYISAIMLVLGACIGFFVTLTNRIIISSYGPIVYPKPEFTIVSILLVFGWLLGYKAVIDEKKQLILLRRLSIALNARGGTEFAFATLTEADFSEADLQYARFKDAKLIGSCFYQAKNHHLAQTRYTVLETRKVRQLAVNGNSGDKDFTGMDLGGLDLSGFDMEEINFSHANLSGTKLIGCKFTGAIIENWNIDKKTQLEGIECSYVYIKADKSKRNPPQGVFKPSDFSKLYQEIADTVDFIAHNPAELQALLGAIGKLKTQSENNEIFVQQVERKNDSVVVKVHAPPDFDKQKLYKHVKESESEIQLLLSESKVEELTERSDLLAKLLETFIQHPINVENKVIIDKSHHQSIENSTISDSNVNYGDNSTLTNSIQQLPENQSELKELLKTLGELIEKGQLSQDDKQDAFQQAQTIVEASKKPAEENRSIVRKALKYFKGLASDLKGIPSAVEQYGKILTRLAVLFGV